MPGSALPEPGGRGGAVQVDPPADPQLHAARRARRQAAAPGRGAAWSSSARSSAASSRAPGRPTPAPIVVHVFGLERAYQPFMPLFNGKRVEVGGYFQPTRRRLLHHAVAPRPANAPTRPSSTSTCTCWSATRWPTCRCGSTRGWPSTTAPTRCTATARPRSAASRRSTSSSCASASSRCTELLAVDHRVAALQRGRPPRRVLRRVVGARALPADRQPAAQGPARHLPAEVRRRRAGGPPRSARPSASPKPSSRRSCSEYVSQSLYQSTARTPSPTRWRSTRTGRSISRATPTARPPTPICCWRCAGRRTPRPAPRRALKLDARPCARPGRARRGSAPSHGQADAAATLLGARGEGGRRHRLPAVLLPGRACCCAARASTRRRSRRIGAPGAGAARRASRRSQPSLADAHGLAAYAALVADDPTAAMARRRARRSSCRRGTSTRCSTPAPASIMRDHGGPAGARCAGRARLERVDPPRSAGAARPSSAKLESNRSPTASAARHARRRPRPSGRPRRRPRARRADPGVPRRRGRRSARGRACSRASSVPRGGVIFKVRLPSRLAPRQREGVRPGRVLQPIAATLRGRSACGARPTPERVYLTYRSTGGAAGTDGVAVAIELLA